jgi:hypothetical protein
MLFSFVFVYTELRSANQNLCRSACRTPAALRPPHFPHRKKKHATAIPLVSDNYECPLAQLLSLHILTNAPGGMGAVLPFLEFYLNSFAKSSFITCHRRFLRPFLSCACALFHFPYPVSPVFATLTKTAGCITTIPILERFGYPERCTGSPPPVASHESPVTFLPCYTIRFILGEPHADP